VGERQAAGRREENIRDVETDASSLSFCSRSLRYILSISVLDHSGQMWLTGFNDIGEMLLGVNANEMRRLSVRPRLLLFSLPSSSHRLPSFSFFGSVGRRRGRSQSPRYEGFRTDLQLQLLWKDGHLPGSFSTPFSSLPPPRVRLELTLDFFNLRWMSAGTISSPILHQTSCSHRLR